MTESAKRKTLIFLGLVIFITVIIAISLPQMELKPGMPLPEFENGRVVIPPDKVQPSMTFPISEFVKVLLILLGVGFILFLIYRMIKTIGWDNLRTYFQLIMVIALISGSVVFLIMLLPKTQSSPSMEMPLPTPSPLVRSPLGPVPPILLWLVGISLLVSSILFSIWIFTASSRRKTTPIDLVGLEAEKARQALMTGQDLKDVIVKCYRQMSMAVEEDRGIERKDYMTTGEFENLLETVGIPHDPIHHLTQLFEAVRYGNWQPNHADELKAINCLEAIMFYSNATKKAS